MLIITAAANHGRSLLRISTPCLCPAPDQFRSARACACRGILRPAGGFGKSARKMKAVKVPRRRWLPLVALFGVAAAGFMGWRSFSTETLTTAEGASLGSLPRGVAPGDLNVIVITLDTTRFDAMGYAGAA